MDIQRPGIAEANLKNKSEQLTLADIRFIYYIVTEMKTVLAQK